jgi:hypothetical protein
VCTTVPPSRGSRRVGAALLLVAGIAALLGKGRLRKAMPPVPKETVASIKTDVEEIKKRAQR